MHRYWWIHYHWRVIRLRRKWKPVGLPVGSKFFDRPVKPVETPVKFSFLATKRHLSTNQNIRIHKYISLCIKLKKNCINKPHLVKTLVEWFQAVTNMLWPLRHAHPRAYLRGASCHVPPLRHGTKQKSANKVKSRNQVIIMHACRRCLHYTWHFSIILISLRVEVAQISDFLVHAKILPL